MGPLRSDVLFKTKTNYDYNIIDCFDYSADWGGTGLAVQPRMGLRSEWRTGHGIVDPAYSVSTGDYLERIQGALRRFPVVEVFGPALRCVVFLITNNIVRSCINKNGLDLRSILGVRATHCQQDLARRKA